MSFELTTGFCSKAGDARDVDTIRGMQPTLQILSIKKIPGSPDRHRLIISDGATFLQSMLSTTINELIENETIKRNSVVKVTRWEQQLLQRQNILILFEMEALGCVDRIGNPVKAPAPSTADDTMAVDSASRATTSSSTVVSSHPTPTPTTKAETVAHVFPIEGLNPYHNKWTLKARVTSKSEKRRWSNAKGEGQLFSVNLMDETGEIKATAFGNAVDLLYDRLEEGKVYYITKGRVVIAKKAFSTLNSDYEITMDVKTEITECHDAGNVPTITYNFLPLNQLANKNVNDFIDAIAVVHKVSDQQEFTSRQGKSLIKRDLTLVDQTGYNVSLTLWGKQSEQWNHFDNPVVAFKGLKVGEYQGGRTLSASSSSTMQIDPDIVECHKLRGWYAAEGKDARFTSHSADTGASGGRINVFRRDEMKTLEDVRQQLNGQSDGPEFFNSRVSIIAIKPDNFAYPACRDEKCNKKVTQVGSEWHCEKCGKNYDSPSYRYLLSMQVADHTGQAWFSAFNDTAIEIVGKAADEAMAIKEESDSGLASLFGEAQGKSYNISGRARTETFGEQTRVRFGVTRVYPIDWATECRSLHKILEGYPQLIPAKYTEA